MICAPAINLVQTSLKLAVPLIFAALGELVVERAGVINVGIEGMMLVGACAAYGAASAFASWPLALGAAILGGVVLALVFAAAALKFQADQVVVGTAANILALGLTGVYVWNRHSEATSGGQDTYSCRSTFSHSRFMDLRCSTQVVLQ